MSETNEIKIICSGLSNANKKYVIAVAQALKFSQAQNNKKQDRLANTQANTPQRTA